MKPNKFSLKLLKYEIINLTGNIFVIIFGVIFPIAMLQLLAYTLRGTGADTSTLHTGLFTQMAMIIPLATIFMGHGINYATEIESGVIQRFKLFGYRESTMIFAKMLSYLIFLTVTFAVYSLLGVLTLDIAAPSVGALFTFVIFFYVFSAILFILAHAIATLCGRFGTTFGIVMALYFLFMILGGNMGISPAAMPNGIRQLSLAIPTYYIAEGMTDFWLGGTFDFLPFVLSTVGLAVLSAALLILALFLVKKGKIKQGVKPQYYE